MSINSLFNPSFLKKKLTEYKNVGDKIKNAREIFERWNNLLQTTNKNEEQLQTDFLNDIFGEVLGYTYKRGENETNLEKEEKTELDGQKPDGILGFFTAISKDCRVVIELKDQRTSLDAKQNRKGDNRTPVGQAFDYATKYQGIEFVIVSNFKEIRLYKSTYQGKFHEFKIEELARSEAKQFEFFLLLAKTHLFTQEKSTSPTHKLLEDNTKEEELIEKRFYNDYKDLRKKLFNHLREQNQAKEPTTLLSKTQKLLDRIIFVCFCEDLNLLPDKIFTKLLKNTQESFVEVSIWQQIKGLFNAIDKGFPQKNINKFNGGLFAKDTELDELVLQDDILKEIIKISDWDFGSELTVNILGHIFEQSITDLEEIKADISGETHDKKQGKRKKDGVFYTPEYITRYIVEEAVGGWLNDRKTELGIEKLPELTEEDFIKKGKKLSKNAQKHIDFWNSYAKILQNIKVLDPACGSGAFLVAVFNFLENEWLTLSEILRKLGDDEQAGLFSYSQVYKNILKNNIYGVDLNPESVQITKLSLWLKTANRSEELTTLDANIKCGNSLIDDPAVCPKAFKWDKEFPFKFDVVVGNPPYVKIYGQNPQNKYFKENFELSNGCEVNLYKMFIEKAYKLLVKNGNFGFITPSNYLTSKDSYFTRKLLIEKCRIIDIFEYPESDNVFENVTQAVATLICKKIQTVNAEFAYKTKTTEAILKYEDILKDEDLKIKSSNNLVGKIQKQQYKLNDFAHCLSGDIHLTAKKQFFTKEPNEKCVPMVRGNQIKRYILEEHEDYCHLDGDSKEHYKLQRIVFQDVSNNAIQRRINGAITINKLCGNSANYILPKDNIDIHFLLAFFNAKLINWYFKQFNMTNHVQVGEIKTIPVPNLLEVEQTPLITHAQTMLARISLFNEKRTAFINYFRGKFALQKITRNLESWHTLEFTDFIKELGKQKVSLSSTDEYDFKPLFDREKNVCVWLQMQITKTDAEIDKMVYALYGLSKEEVRVVENLVV